MKMTEQKRDTISFYKQLLDPMGYTIMPKVAPIVKDTSWRPKAEDIKKYNEMDSLKVEKTIQELKSTIVVMQRTLSDIKQKVVEYMNRQEPNEFTQPLYTGTYTKGSILKTGIKLESEALIETQNLINYLTALKLDKLKEELVQGLQRQVSTITSAEVNKELGEPTLVVNIE
jgi:hypothetical protein